MAKPNIPLFTDENILQKLIRWVCVFVCLGSTYGYFSNSDGTYTQAKYIGYLLQFGIGGYVAYWIAGNLPTFFNYVLNSIVFLIAKFLRFMGIGITEAPDKLQQVYVWWPKTIKGIFLLLFATGAIVAAFYFLEGLYYYLKMKFHFAFISDSTDKVHNMIWAWNKDKWTSFFNYFWFIVLFAFFFFVTLRYQPARQEKPKQNNSYHQSEEKQDNEKSTSSASSEDDFAFNDDRFADSRFSTPKKKASYKAACKAEDDKSITLDERVNYFKFRQRADEGKVNGIKALPRRR